MRQGTFLCCAGAAAVLAMMAGCGGGSKPKSASDGHPVSGGYFRQLSPPSAPDFVNTPRDPAAYFMPDIMGSGAALWDYDGDDDLDILLLNGAPARQPGIGNRGCRLYRQDPGPTYTDVTEAACLNSSIYAVGLAVGDIDNDGDPDFFCSAYGPDGLWRNNGDGTFTDATATAGISNDQWGAPACFFDFDRDGWLDLYVGNYVDYYAGLRCEDGSGRPDFCNPKDLPGTVDRLYRNVSNGGEPRFVDVTVQSGLATQAGRALGTACRDFNGDLLPDIYVANDMDPNFLWIQQPDGTFRDEGYVRGVAVNFFGDPEASMGVGVGDLNQDSYFDLVVMNLSGQTSTLYAGRPGGMFIDVTPASGLGPPTLKHTTFGVATIDLECDGDLDLAIVNGSVMHSPGTPRGRNMWDEYAAPNLLFRNDGQGHFEDISPLAGPFTERSEVTRAVVCGDIDRDGDLDLLTTQCAGPACLYLNEVPREGSWLSVRAFDPSVNRDAVGARLTVRVRDRLYQRELNPSASYLTSHDSRMHFGLGKSESYDELVVLWPDGSQEVFPGGPANRFVSLYKGSGHPPPPSP